MIVGNEAHVLAVNDMVTDAVASLFCILLRIRSHGDLLSLSLLVCIAHESSHSIFAVTFTTA